MYWLARRVLIAFSTLITVLTIGFILLRVMPGNPIEAYVYQQIAQGTPPELAYSRAKMFYAIYPQKPLLEQYFDYIRSVFHGDFGKSFQYGGRPALDIVMKALPWTVFTLSIALLLQFIIGIIIGMIIAYRHGTKVDSISVLILMAWRGIPDYVIGIIILIILGVQLHLFPYVGEISPGVSPGPDIWHFLEFIKDALWHATLPILTYVIVGFPGWALAMRGSTINVLGEDYIAVAEIRGLPERRIAITYVGRNAILPLFTSFMITLGYMFGGSHFIEWLFTYRGIGYFFLSAIWQRDYAVVQACLTVEVLAVIIGVTLADVLYGLLDPRVRVAGEGR